jgi:hypothetical protein
MLFGSDITTSGNLKELDKSHECVSDAFLSFYLAMEAPRTVQAMFYGEGFAVQRVRLPLCAGVSQLGSVGIGSGPGG